METNIELANRFREVILDGTWIANTNFKNQLEDLKYEIAIKKFENLNSIAVLAQHINYYIQGMNNVFKGGNLEIKDKFSFDFEVIKSQQEWNNFLNIFWNDTNDFAEFVEKISEEKLEEFFTDQKYGSYKRNINAMIEHSYYHLGQIVLIKKIITQ